jgi:glucosylceramidase
MNKQSRWLFTCALLVVCHSGLTAQQASDVRMWLTTPDQSALLSEQKDPLPFSSTVNNSPGIDVNDMQQFQQIDGFGFALTGGSAQLLMRMEPGPRAELLKELFGSEGNTVRVSYLRLTIGASDMNERVYSYDDLPSGETDANLAHFSLGPDRADVIPVLKQILAINPAIKYLHLHGPLHRG